MLRIDQEEWRNRAKALTEEQKDVVVKILPTDMLYAELDRRVTTALGLVDSLKAELNSLSDNSILQDYEKVLKNCDIILHGGLIDEE